MSQTKAPNARARVRVNEQNLGFVEPDEHRESGSLGSLLRLVKLWCHERGARYVSVGVRSADWHAIVRLSDGARIEVRAPAQPDLIMQLDACFASRQVT